MTLSGRTALIGANRRGTAHATAQKVNIRLMKSSVAESSASPAASPPAGFFCVPRTTLVRPEKLKWMKLAASFARSAGVTMTYTYTMGQRSFVGVGISPTGGPGTFTAGGTYAVSVAQTIGFAPVRGPRSVFYETQVEPGLFKTAWDSPLCGSTTWQTQIIKIAGGAQEVDTTPSDATRCTPYQSGSNLDLATSTASIFSVGVTISGLGFNASAQTGYDKGGNLRYDVISGQELCGVENYPASTNPGPGLVVAGKPT